MNMFYFLIKCDSSVLNMCCPTFLLGVKRGCICPKQVIVGLTSPKQTINRKLKLFTMRYNVISISYPWQLELMDVESGVKTLP